MRDAALPVTLIVVGTLWLIWRFGWFPDINWIIAAGLAQSARIGVGRNVLRAGAHRKRSRAALACDTRDA